MERVLKYADSSVWDAISVGFPVANRAHADAQELGAGVEGQPASQTHVTKAFTDNVADAGRLFEQFARRCNSTHIYIMSNNSIGIELGCRCSLKLSFVR